MKVKIRQTKLIERPKVYGGEFQGLPEKVRAMMMSQMEARWRTYCKKHQPVCSYCGGRLQNTDEFTADAKGELYHIACANELMEAEQWEERYWRN